LLNENAEVIFLLVVWGIFEHSLSNQNIIFPHMLAVNILSLLFFPSRLHSACFCLDSRKLAGGRLEGNMDFYILPWGPAKGMGTGEGPTYGKRELRILVI